MLGDSLFYGLQRQVYHPEGTYFNGVNKNADQTKQLVGIQINLWKILLLHCWSTGSGQLRRFYRKADQVNLSRQAGYCSQFFFSWCLTIDDWLFFVVLFIGVEVKLGPFFFALIYSY